MSETNFQTLWASLLIDGFVRAGVREAIVSPGSRSTPAALAAIRAEGLRVRSIVDERSAAFFALGQARATGVPSLLICTSGTAGTHYFPAVIEADYSYTPMLLLTADRPPELQGNAGPQTMDQVKLFGDHARRFFDLGLPDRSVDALRALRRKASQATLAATHPVPGAVHLNAWFRKPLEPARGGDAELDERVESVRSEPLTKPWPHRTVPDPAGVEELAGICRRSKRGLIVCGPAPVSQARYRSIVVELAETLRYPLLAEGASQVRFTGIDRPIRCDGFDTFLRSEEFCEAHPPEVVIQIGLPPTSKGWEHYIRRHTAAPRFVIAPFGWNDPQNTATSLIFGSISEVVTSLKGALSGAFYSKPSKWVEDFTAVDGLVWRIIEERVRGASGPLTKAALARTVLNGLRPDSLFAVANSLPIREVDNFCPGSAADAPFLSQKGVNGIDGLISGAAGAAHALNRPATVYLGDLAFLHDLHGLAAARHVDKPFIIIVAQNDGGRIFEQLPIASVPGVDDDTLSFWTTPHGLDFSHAAALFKHAYGRAETVEQLRGAIRDAHRSGGCTVIEAVVPPSGAAVEHESLVDDVINAIGGGGARTES